MYVWLHTNYLNSERVLRLLSNFSGVCVSIKKKLHELYISQTNILENEGAETSMKLVKCQSRLKTLISLHIITRNCVRFSSITYLCIFY